MIRVALLLTLFSSLPALAHQPPPAGVLEAHFGSASLNREMSYRVLLPADYAKSNRRYPVLYLLHGLYGDFTNWTELTKLATYARGLDLIIVMPDGNNAWYVNSATQPWERFEDYIGNDLIAHIDEKFRTIPTREGRAIAGLSMGGYGALKFAFKSPARFSFVGSLSGALNAPLDLDTLRQEFREGLLKVFGPDGNPWRAANDIFALLDKNNAEDLPYIYVDCGTSDPFLATNRQFAARLKTKNVRYEFHEMPGGHEWPYWDRQVQALLRSLGGVITVRAPEARTK